MDVLSFFYPDSSSRTAAPRVQTAFGNYVASVRKPTAVTHSCCGNFTGPKELNLVICKGSLVSIYLMTDNGLEHLQDFPMFGRVVFMELSSLHCLKNKRLFIATEVDKLCMFDWDVETSNVISVQTMLFQPTLAQYPTGDGSYPYLEYLQGGTICPNGVTVVLYYMRNQLRIIDLNHLGHGTTRFRKTFSSTKILDVKFLKNLYQPALALLYMGNDGNFHSGIYEITAQDIVPRRLLQPDHTIEPTLLIPNLHSFLIIGKQGVIYFDDTDYKTKFLGYIDIQAYGRVDEKYQRSRYLLGGHDGHLSVIEIEKHSDARFSRLTLRPLGKTSIASSITYLRDDVVFVGSRYADSQLLKMHQLHEPRLNMNTPTLQVLKTYTNSGPVINFSLSNKPAGVRKLVMCCGTQEDSSLEGVRTGVGINEKLSVNVSNIQRIWSLKKYSSSKYHTFLVLQKKGEGTFVLAIDDTGEIRRHTMEGLTTDSITICCHEAGDRQFTQVTKNSVRLLGSKDGQLRDKWSAESNIYFASATAEQVLLATQDKQLVYLEIGYWKLVVRDILQEYDVACLDITPVGTNTSRSKLAAVGLWTEHSVLLLSLPGLQVLTVERLESHVPRCVLLCAFEQVSYLLCALEDGTLLSFKVNKDNGNLQERKTKELGGLGKTLGTFSSKGVSYAFLSTEVAPKLIFTKKQELQYNMLNLTNIHDMCVFQLPDISEGLAIVKENEVVICTMGDNEGHVKIPMINYGRRICHQDESESSVVLVEEKKQPPEGFGRHVVQLLDKELHTLSTFRLNEREHGLVVVSCSFAGDNNAYYCVGTSIDVPMLGEVNIVRGRILVFAVTDGRLDLIFQTPTSGSVKYLKALHGGLLGIVAIPMDVPHYYEWQLHGGVRELNENPNLGGVEPGGTEERFAMIDTTNQRYEFHDVNIDIEPRMRTRLTAILKLQNDSSLYTDGLYNILSSNGFTNGGIPTKVGAWHTGEFVTQIKTGTLARMSDEDHAQAPSVIFSTMSGAIGVIVSLPPKVYKFLNRLQMLMREAKKGKGCPNQMYPRKCVGLSSFSPSREFIDGDFIESFPTLALEDQNAIAQTLDVNVCTLMGIVAYVTHFH